MSAFDLTTVANVKAWLGLPAPPTQSDPTLAGLVTAASRTILAALSRTTIFPGAFSETTDLETDRVYLSHWPVTSVQSVILDGLAVPPVPSGAAPPHLGYLLQPGDAAPPGRPQALDIFGRRYYRRRQNLVVGYQAGYAVQGEAAAVPASAPFTVTAYASYGPWASDLGVRYAATGLALTPVTGAPIGGQYSVANGVYRFAAADAGAALLINYGYTPQDLTQAATELAAERFRASDRIGLKTKSLGGQETIAYDLSGMSAAVEALITPYKRTLI